MDDISQAEDVFDQLLDYFQPDVKGVTGESPLRWRTISGTDWLFAGAAPSVAFSKRLKALDVQVSTLIDASHLEARGEEIRQSDIVVVGEPSVLIDKSFLKGAIKESGVLIFLTSPSTICIRAIIEGIQAQRPARVLVSSTLADDVARALRAVGTTGRDKRPAVSRQWRIPGSRGGARTMVEFFGKRRLRRHGEDS